MTEEEIEKYERQQAASSERWRNLWRVHFYSGIIVAPFLVMFAITGLVIPYTQPIQDGFQSELRRVDRGSTVVSFDEQAATVETNLPEDPIVSMTPPRDSGASTVFGLDSGRSAYVNPYTGDFLGADETQTTLVRWSNALHGQLNNDSLTIPLPAASALWDGEKVMRDYVVGDLVLELVGSALWAVSVTA
ncbi:MAG: PepSY domain-containing protein [Actinobacteria bacterium]|nr:PepSY domain-containing protein [Actinomycetota bacterium]